MPNIRPISSLVENISGSVTALVDQLTGRNGYPVNPKTNVESVITQGNWLTLSFPYTFSVVNVSDGSQAGRFTDFKLPLAPSSIKQTENFAISIKPVQGGTTVTHSGNKYKNLQIRGTTGLAPFRGAGGVNAKDGKAIFQPDELKYLSGYEVFLRLRNWFRSYYEFKKTNPVEAKSHRLVFKNYKDGEFLVVELIKFDMDRQASKSFLYDYDLEFKVLAHLQADKANDNSTLFERVLERAVNALDQARGTFLRTQDILRQIEGTYNAVVIEPLRKTTLAIKAFKGIGLVAGDVSSRAIQETVSEAKALQIALGVKETQDEADIYGGVDRRITDIELPSDLKSATTTQGSALISTFGEGLMALDVSIFPQDTIDATLEEQNYLVTQPLSFYQDLIDELNRVRRNAEDLFNLGSTEYNDIFDRDSTLSADPTKGVTADEYDVLKAFSEAVTGLNLILSTEDLLRSPYDEKIKDMIARFNGNLGLFALPAVKEIRIDAGVTLERLAQDYLGDATRWGEIVEVNNLKTPYIVQDPTDKEGGLLTIGDKILIPTEQVGDFSNTPRGKTNKINENQTELERSLGIDFKLDDNFDLIINNSSDLELVGGSENMAQQVILKLSYEKGEVMGKPQLGSNLLPGTKFPPLHDIQDGVVNTLTSDSRIESVQNLNITREGNALRLNFNLKLKKIDIPVPISIEIV